MQLTTDGIKKLQETQKAVYWKIRDLSRRYEINRQEENIDLNDSINILHDFLNQLKGETVIVSLYTTLPGKRIKGQEYDSGLEIKFKPADNVANVNSNSISGIGLKEYLELKDQISKAEIERIKRDIIEEQKPNFIEKIFTSQQGQQLITALITFMQPKPEPQPEPQPIKGNKLEEALNLIRQQGEDPEHLIICLAKYAAKNPGVLATIKPIIGA